MIKYSKLYFDFRNIFFIYLFWKMTFKMTKNMLQHHRLCSTAPEATVPLSEWTPIYRLRTNAGKFWKMDIFTSDDTTDTAFRADSPYRTRPLGSFNPRHQWNCFSIRHTGTRFIYICVYYLRLSIKKGPYLSSRSKKMF
jgi:hypothetical protein